MSISFRSLLASGIGAFITLPVIAFAAGSVTIQSLVPGSTAMANTKVTLQIVATGFNAPLYQVSDSFSPTTLSASNIEGGGKLTWTPEKTDVGTHVITIKVNDNDGNSASVVQTITVLPPPSIAIQSIAPGKILMPGTKLTFSVVPSGFTNPSYTISDTFSGSTATLTTIDGSGGFAWTPDVSQNGDHTITIYASDTLGHSASAFVTIRVGAGPTLTVSPILPSNTLNVGQSVTFSVGALNFSPTAYSVGDTFSGTTLSNNNITLTGAFSWTPQASDAGVHTIILTGRVGAYGDSATTSVQLTVLGAGGTPPVSIATTSAGIDVSALQAKLAALQAQIATQSTSADVPASFVFTLYLHAGSDGDEVMRLQRLLAEKGFFSVAPNGNFGPSTIAAVKKFQKAHGLDSLGVVGPATRDALNAMLENTVVATPATTAGTGVRYVFQHFMGVGDDDTDVVELQKRLAELGFMTGNPTGYYGAATEKAMKKFQHAHAIPETGYVNTLTRTALNA